MTPRRPTTRGLVGWAARHRGAVTFLLLFLIASPATPDDRQLLQANAGAKAWVLLIMDSSHSMNDEFSDVYRMPAYMDDFVYVENSAAVGPVSYGSKIAIAKSVLRDVIAKSETGSGINWAFSYYRNPNQVIGASNMLLSGDPVTGARAPGDSLENGGLEWLYFANCVSNNAGTCNGTLISDTFSTAEYPDLQEGRFLQFGHKVMHNYLLDSRPPFVDNNPNLGTWRGAFGPHGLSGTNRGTVIYRNANAIDGATGLPYEVRMSVTNFNYGDQSLVVKLEKWGPPGIPTATITNTPTITSTETVTPTPTSTKTVAFTKTQTPTSTITNTRTVTSTATNSRTPTTTRTNTNTATVTKTATVTNTQTVTQTPSHTTTPSITQTATKTPTSTVTETPTVTSTVTQTKTPVFTKTPTQTFTITPTKTITVTPTKTLTPTLTKTPTTTFTNTKTFTPTKTFTVTQTKTITPTKTITQTVTKTKTFTVTSTATKTFTQTKTPTSTPTNTITKTPVPPTNTHTETPVPPTSTITKTSTLTPTSTKTKTPTRTHTKTPTVTKTRTPTQTGTPAPFTPTATPTDVGGAVPAPSLLPIVARWFAPAVRGLLAMAPPPPPMQATGPCQFITGAAATKPSCAPCPWDGTGTTLCAFYDANGDNVRDPGEVGPGDPASPEFWNLPANLRGFDDPQADGDTNYVLISTIRVRYNRADLYALPFADGTHRYETRNNGNPPWGSCTLAEPANPFNCSVKPDHDADQAIDNPAIPDRHNHGMYAALYDKQPVAWRPDQQYPFDAFAGKSCPLDLPSCDPFLAGNDCGGFAHFGAFTSNNGTNYSGSAPDVLGGPGGSPYLADEPPSKDLWPVVPFARDWPPYDAGLSADYPSTGPTSSEAIRRLLRFVSSIVSYNSAAPVTTAYTLAESSREIVATAPGTPLAGALEDAYKYFETSVFKTAPTAIQDPAIDCRNYIVVYITDGKDECNSDPCAGGRNGAAFPDGGVSKDLAEITLPESAPGARAAANLVDPSVRVKGIPVNVVAMANSGATYYPTLQCIADNSGGDVFLASNRDQLESALETILDFKRTANSFVAPAVPAFGSAAGGDTAMIGAVIPSHLNSSGVLSSWSIWSGSLKSFQLDSNGLIPVVTAAAPTITPTPSPGGPTPGPTTPTNTPVPGTGNFPDESDPNNASAAVRKPVWNAGRVLGYTNPVPDLGANVASAVPVGNAGAIRVWPGRKMVFARDPATPGSVPMVRSNFLPNTGSCAGAKTAGSCFNDLMSFMNLLPWSAPNETLAQFTVKFLRGGETPNGSANGIGRDEILNQVKPVTIPKIGPTDDPHFSYYYQDDIPQPGTNPPQAPRTDGGNAPASGYPHRLGDIFHSEAIVIEPPRYFQYLSLNLAPNGPGSEYETFAALHAKRRKVAYVGSNDGFLHAFDAGVWNGDTTNFLDAFDLGSGREIFAYTPRASFLGDKFPALLEFSPQPQYFVDGSMGQADVFIDPEFTGGSGPDVTERVWRSVLIGGLRQGGSGYYALDITQPDHIETNTALPTFGEMLDPKANSPHCLDGSGSSCDAGATSNRPYPSILWEFTDTTPAACTDGCTLAPPLLGETWSRPVLGRIKIMTTVSPLVFEDRYVAIFGGGYDPSHSPADDPVDTTVGRAFYIVDIETGQILFKASEGQDESFTTIDFGPMPAAPAVADYNDDGYLDVVYIGDVRGNMWRINLTPDPALSPPRGELQGDGQVHGYMPFHVFDTCKDVDGAVFPKPPPATGKNCVQPIFYDPGIVYLGGAASPPALGIAFGTGDRSSLTRSNPTDGGAPPVYQANGFYYVIDGGSDITMSRNDLVDLTPPAANPCVPYDPAVCGVTGFVLDYETGNEKTTSTVFSTFGELSIVTFTPDSVSPCATNGSSFRYRFFYLTGQPGYTTPDYNGYRQDLGPGYAAAGQSVSPDGDIIDTVMFSGGGVRQDVEQGQLQTIEQNWKEQQ